MNHYGINDMISVYGTWMLLLNNIIPISLLVTLETVQFFQAYHLERTSKNKIEIKESNNKHK
jgi:hypothetical protein